MASLLEGQLKKVIAKAFSSGPAKLKLGTIRENQPSSLDDYGDEQPPDTVVTHTFRGIRERFDAAWMRTAQIPETDVSILIILGTVADDYFPKQDDLIYIENMWHKLRRILKVDPAGASMLAQCYVVTDPDATT